MSFDSDDLNQPECFRGARLTQREIYALQQLEEGNAAPDVQRLALQAILRKLCRVYDLHFVAGKPDQTAFLAGRGYVGQEIIKFLRLTPDSIKQFEGEKNV